MNDEYGALKTSWGGFAGFDRLLARSPNNAFLVSIASYTELLPAFGPCLRKKTAISRPSTRRYRSSPGWTNPSATRGSRRLIRTEAAS